MTLYHMTYCCNTYNTQVYFLDHGGTILYSVADLMSENLKKFAVKSIDSLCENIFNLRCMKIVSSVYLGAVIRHHAVPSPK